MLNMGIIDEKYIHKKTVLSDIYDKGKQLYENKNILSLKTTKTGESCVEFSVSISDKKNKIYNALIEIIKRNDGYDVCNYECKCSEFIFHGGFCAHLAAAAFVINDEYDEKSLDEFIDESSIGVIKNVKYKQEDNLKENDFEAYIQQVFDSVADKLYSNNSSSARTINNNKTPARSSTALLNAISKFSESEREKYCVSSNSDNVRIEPVFHIINNRLDVEFKIGREKLYVVKNIETLAENIRNKRYSKYGKNFEMVHSKEAFADEYSMVVEYITNLNFNSYSAYRYGYSSANEKRYIDFKNNSIDDFLKLYIGKYVECYESDSFGKLDLYIIQENPQLPILIKGMDNEEKIEITFPKAQIIYGRSRAYVFYNGVLYCTSSKYTDKLKPVLDIIRSNNITQNYRGYYNFEEKPGIYELYRQDYGAFLDTIYPVMDKYMQVSVSNIDLSKFENEEGKFEVYLDLDDSLNVTCEALAIYGNNIHYLTVMPDSRETYRDFKTEYELRRIIAKFFPEKSQNSKFYILDAKDDERLADLVEEGVKEIEQIAGIYASDEFKKIKITRIPKISTGISIKGELLNVSWDVEGMSTSELNDILDSYRKKKKYHRLKSGELLNLNGSGLDVLSEIKDDFHISKAQIKNGNIELPIYRAMYLDYLMSENSSKIKVNKDECFEKIINDFEKVKNSDFELPKEITAVLRPYQIDGYKWACMIAKLGFGGVLADDMGLGKTLQIISYLCREKSVVHLVICPASLVYNWESEFNKFAPSMNVVAVVGNANERKVIIDEYNNYDVLITSYDLLKRDIDEYRDKEFYCEVIDEAQYIKNPSTLAAKAVKSICSKVRFALTGTPIENRLSELWSIFEYLMPGYLYSYKSFKERFEEHIINPSKSEDRENAMVRLRNMIAPFLMRRLKKDVLKDLPDKIEDVIYAKFDTKQELLYRATEKNLLMSIKKSSKDEINENKLQILAQITRLRQICCDPSLILEDYNGSSAKLDAGLELIESAVLSGHKVLLFSQFTSMLDLIKDRLNKTNMKCYMLTGSTSKKKRRELVENFQEGNADVFLISLKAGGTGLNLTAADVVIHYDPWWNIAAQNQATDRVHRIGQQNKVTVIKLITKGTIEERILKLQDKKQELADKVISGDNASISSFSKEELMELFSG